MERSGKKYRISLRIAPGDLQVVRRVADLRGVSVQEIIRDCVGEWALRQRHFENTEKASALMESFVSEFRSCGVGMHRSG